LGIVEAFRSGSEKQMIEFTPSSSRVPEQRPLPKSPDSDVVRVDPDEWRHKLDVTCAIRSAVVYRLQDQRETLLREMFARLPTPRSPTADEIAEHTRKTQPDQGYFYEPSLDLLAWAEQIDGTAFIAFRGTVDSPLNPRSKNWREVNYRAQLEAIASPETGGPKCHTGFWKAWKTLYPAIRDWLGSNEPPPRSVVITGHSLGAALAQIAAYELSTGWPVDRVVVFASPTLGNASFNESYSRKAVGETGNLETRTIRYLLLSDIIVLPLARYRYGHSELVHSSIDEYGGDRGVVPSFLWRIVDAISGAPEPPPVGDPTYYGRTPEFDQIFRQPVAKPMFWLLGPAIGGLWGWGWLIAAGIGLSGWKRINFHKMQRYERAMKWRMSRYVYFNKPTSM
jgi:hypothetical protein